MVLVLGALLALGGTGAPGQSAAAGNDRIGEDLLQAAHYAEAMDRFEAALAQQPNDLHAHEGEVASANAWASAEALQQHGDRAMLILERALTHLPKEPRLLVSFGLEATALGQFPIAQQALEAAHQLQPKDPNAIYALARLEVESQHLPEAERDLKAYLVLRPEDASAYFGLGHVYAMEQRGAEAKAAFERSLALQPAQTESYYQLGQMALEAQQDAEAQMMFAKVLARAPGHAGALTGMGQLALRAKQYARAEQLLLQAERSDPQYAAPHYFRGLALAHLGRKAEAEEELKHGDGRQHATRPEDPAPAGATEGARPEP